ncbi:MAG: hypothetical protein AAGI01_14825 [Myxococcota bacterium]
MGRPTKLTPDLQEKLLKAVESGHSDTYAAASVGISRYTLMLWKLRGREGDPEFFNFFNRYTRAHESRRLTLETAVRADAAENGELALKALPVLHPREHGKGARDREIEDEQFLRRLDPLLNRVSDAARLEFLRAMAEEESARLGLRAGGSRGDGDDSGADGSGDVPATTH